MIDYQNQVVGSLEKIFGETNVIKEWHVAKGSRDNFTRELYCPRLDVAVGPFNIRGWGEEDRRQIVRHLNRRRQLIKAFWGVAENRDYGFEHFTRKRNVNPRCLLAIEIENSGSSKHMLGNIANVSILGSVGIVVPFTKEKLALCKRIRRYVDFAARVEKIKSVFENVLIVNKDDFLRTINNFIRTVPGTSGTRKVNQK